MGNKDQGLALFNLAIGSKLRNCDLVKLRVENVSHGALILKRALILQQKTVRLVQFEITQQTRDSLVQWIEYRSLGQADFMFRSGLKRSNHLTTRQYARIVNSWVSSIGLSPNEYDTHSIRRTKVTLIYTRTNNLRVIQLLLGRTKLESTVQYLGFEVDDALQMAQKIDVY